MRKLCLLGSFLWGINVVLMKSLLAEISPFLLAFWRVFFSSAVLFLIGKITSHSFRITKQQLFLLLLLGFFNVSLNFTFSFWGMKMNTGSHTALFNALSPVVVVILLWLFEHQKPSFKTIKGLFFTIVGIFCALHFDLSGLSWGHLFLVLSLACYSGAIIYGKKLEIKELPKTFYILLLGSLPLLTMCYFDGSLGFLHLSHLQWLLFILFSVFGFALIQWIYFEASKKLGMEEVSFYMNLNPIFTYFGALLFLGEPLDFDQLLGMGLILVGLIISKKGKILTWSR